MQRDNHNIDINVAKQIQHHMDSEWHIWIAMYTRQSVGRTRGPIIVPCDTPEVTGASDQVNPLTTTSISPRVKATGSNRNYYF